MSIKPISQFIEEGDARIAHKEQLIKAIRHLRASDLMAMQTILLVFREGDRAQVSKSDLDFAYEITCALEKYWDGVR